MKKFLAVILSVMMVLSVGLTSVVAFAAPATIESQETTKKPIIPSVTVNGNKNPDVSYDYDESNPNKIIFTYTGDGDLNGWNFYDGNGNLLVEGVDYTVVYDGNSAIVTILGDIEKIQADCIVKDDDVNPTKPTKPNHNNESPNTGAMGLTGLAVAGAGVAILTAVKRKSDAE